MEMDELEMLKKDWKQREKDLPHFKSSELYPMLLKKSSSIVKWIFIISIIELALSTFLNVFLSDEKFWKDMVSLHLKTFTIVAYIVGYLISIFFIFYFYKNYKRIVVTDSASRLMENILKTRKVVKTYILYVLVSNGIVMMFYFTYILLNSPQFEVIIADLNWYQWAGIMCVYLIVTLLFLTLLWGIYSLFYGVLLRKLKRNYKELKRLEL